jgi:hypothetical protein
MKTEISDNKQILITLESEFEADIMSACLNWGALAMRKSGLIKGNCSRSESEKVNIEIEMWNVYEQARKQINKIEPVSK